MIKFSQVSIAIACVCVALLIGAITCERGGRRIDGPPGFKSPCGTADQLSKRVGGCLVELFEILEGKIPEAKTDNDIQGHCARFNNTERCARTIAKDCLTGLHKTATGAVASATRRWRQAECKSLQTRGRYYEPLRCAIKNGPEVKKLYQQSTGVLQGVRDLDIAPEEKLMKMCCLLNKIDVEMAKIFDRNCASSTPVILSIVHAMTDDARSTLCVAPKCEHALDKVMNHKYTPPQNFIEPVMQILFQISV